MGSVGSSFGPYQLERRLGAGGMAETFVAVRRGPGGFEQRVCLKRILPAFEADEEFVRQFLHEARLSATLRHTNVAQVVDFGVHDGSHYLVLELIEGSDLRGLLKAVRREGATLPHPLVSLLATDLAAALDHAAERGVVHRDISPSNVLLSTAGEIKLTDFGIARAVSQPGVTRTGIIKGKVPYMAPEYANHGRCDGRSDLFGLGVVLFECLAGERPYDGATDLETVGRSSRGDHRPLAELAPDAPVALVDAVERLIAPNPADRFASAADLLDALAEAPPPPRARRDLGRRVRALGGGTGPYPQVDAAATRPAKGAAGPADDIGLLPTQAASAAEGERTATEAWPDARPPGADPVPEPPAPAQVAGPNDATRTRVPAGAAPEGHPEEPAAAPATIPPPTPAPGPSFRRRRTWVVAGAAALAIASGGLWAWTATPDGPPPDRAEGGTVAPSEPTRVASPPEPGPSSARAAAAEPPERPAEEHGSEPPAGDRASTEGEGAAEAPEPTAPKERPSSEPADDTRRARPTRGRLHVSVIPYGDVWIDGRHIGRSPVQVWVRPGTHTVATGDRAPEKSTTVRVRAGRTRRVVLR